MKKFLTRLLISLLIGAAMLYWATTQTSFSGTWPVLVQAQWSVLVPYFAIMAAQHAFRAWRWAFLLAPIHPVSFWRILPISSVGFLAILILPLRMGELARPYLISDPPHIRMSHGLGTMAVERVFDGLILSLTAFGAVQLAPSTAPRWVSVTGLVALGLFCIVLVVLVMTLWQRERAVTLCRRLVGLISPRLADRAASIARGVVEGFRVLPDWRRLLPFVGATCAYWYGNVLAVWVLAKGFNIDLDMGAGIAFIALIGIGIMIPAAPGFVGSFEVFAGAALDLYSPASKGKRGAFIIATHATNALWYIGAGLVGLLSGEVTFRKVWTLSTREPPPEKLDTADPAADDKQIIADGTTDE